MSGIQTQMGDVTYNAADQRFEALVTFHTDRGRVRVASHFDAPMTTGFDAAARGLQAHAMTMIDKPGHLQSRLTAKSDDKSAARRHSRPVSGFLMWLSARHSRAA